jgi:LDH2 family malate/lactate/ureidoglycolate dehydrogenase
MLGTNPLTVGIPSDEDFPFCLDCATSVSQRGKIEHYNRIGKTMPPGWVINREGRTGTDPAAALEDLNKGAAALVPLGGIGDETAGYKGYGYATVVEILSAALQQGSFLKALNGIDEAGKKTPYHLGHFFIAIDISAFVELDKFKKTTGDILRTLRASVKAPGQERIYTAGEKEYLAWLSRKDTGVPLNESLKKIVKALKDEYHLDNYQFSF